jgi:2-keto-4-pentenoate hydratase/2-oxohepta-3-ene-1,7-dioic acid hydratase in catechol pathway
VSYLSRFMTLEPGDCITTGSVMIADGGMAN